MSLVKTKNDILAGITCTILIIFLAEKVEYQMGLTILAVALLLPKIVVDLTLFYDEESTKYSALFKVLSAWFFAGGIAYLAIIFVKAGI